MISPVLKKRLQRVAFITLRVFLILFVLLALIVMFFEDRFIYYPSPIPAENALADLFPRGTAVECWMTASDGVRINGLHVARGGPADPGKTRHTLLWCHGNAGNLADRADMARDFLKIVADVFLFDYRGYGKSGGTPSEEGLYRDAEAAYDFLVKERQVSPARLIVFGKSLGGAVAVDLASKRPCAGLVLQSTFTSVPDVAGSILPVFPVSWFMSARFDALGRIGKCSVPKLFIHSPADEVIAYRLGRALFEAAPEPKAFYEVAKAGHNETYLVGGSAYWKRIEEFIGGLDK